MNNAKKADKALSFTKKLILFVLIMAEVEILFSYALAFLGMGEIAEQLSVQIVITVLGSIGFYTIKSLIENLSKYGGLFGINNAEKVIEQSADENDSTPNTAEEFVAENNVGTEDIE